MILNILLNIFYCVLIISIIIKMFSQNGSSIFGSVLYITGCKIIKIYKNPPGPRVYLESIPRNPRELHFLHCSTFDFDIWLWNEKRNQNEQKQEMKGKRKKKVRQTFSFVIIINKLYCSTKT